MLNRFYQKIESWVFFFLFVDFIEVNYSEIFLNVI